jgi:hypothetical protein
VTKTSLAKALNISPGRLSHYLKQGLPWPTTIEDAIAWKDANIDTSGNKTGPKVTDEELGALTVESLGYTLPEGVSLYDVLERMQDRERNAYGKMLAAEKHLSENSDAKLSSRLQQLQREHTETTKLRVAIENTILDMEARCQKLVPATKADEWMNEILQPLGAFVRCLPNSANNASDRELLIKVALEFEKEIDAAIERATDKALSTTWPEYRMRLENSLTQAP